VSHPDLIEPAPVNTHILNRIALAAEPLGIMRCALEHIDGVQRDVQRLDRGCSLAGLVGAGALPRRMDVAGQITADEITRIADYADRLGVRLKVQVSQSAIDLDWVGRRPSAPVGAGAAVMRALCDFADDASWPIRLNVLHGRDRLIAFYSRFGFSTVHDALDDLDTTEMERTPMRETCAAVAAINATGVHSVEAMH
jgi:hypothetical protein